MPYSIQLPDGSTVDGIPDNIDPKEAARQIAAKRPELMGQKASPANKPESGILASAKQGLEQLESSVRTGYKSFTGDARQAGQEGIKRSEGIQRRYADEVGMDKVGAAYDKDGLFGGAKEIIRQAPHAIAQQIPNLGATWASGYAGAKIGGAGGSLIAPGPGTAIGAIVGGLGGAFLPGFLASQGANVQRQVQENPDAPVNMVAATGAAAASGALDTVGNLLPFLGTAKRVLGPKLGIAAIKNPAAAERLAKEGLAMSVAKGTGVGILAETPTEVVQQMLERAQAGLSLTDAEALKEYKDTAYQAALSGPLGVAGRFADKGAARSEVLGHEVRAKQEQAQQLKAQQEQEAAAQQAKMQDPAYAAQVAQDYKAAEAQFAQLKAAAKVGKDASMADRLLAKQAREKLAAFETDVLKPKAEAYLQVKPLLDAQAQQEAAAQLKAQQEQEAAAQLKAQQEQDAAQPRDLFGEPLQAPAVTAATPADVQAQQAAMAQLKARQAQDPAYATQIAQDYKAAEAQFAQLKAAAAQDPTVRGQVAAFERDVLAPKAEAYAQVKPLLDAQAEVRTLQNHVANFNQKRIAAAANADVAGIRAADAQIATATQQLAAAEKQLKDLGFTEHQAPSPDQAAVVAKIDEIKEALRVNAEEGDHAAITRNAKQLEKLEKQLDTGILGEQNLRKEEGASAQRTEALAADMAQGKDAARKRRENVVAEEAWLRNRPNERPRYAGEARQERQAQSEIDAMERAALPLNVTEQRVLPLQAAPVQYTSAATTQRREATREELVAQVKELTKRLDTARAQRGTGVVQQDLREQIRAKIDEIRDFDSAIARQEVPRGTDTRAVSPGIPSRTEDVVRAEIQQALKERRTNPEKLKQLLAEWRGQRAYAALAGSRKPGSGQLPASQNIPDIERTITSSRTTEEDLREAIARAPADNPVVQDIERNLSALARAEEGIETPLPPSRRGTVPSRAADDVAKYLHQLRIGQDTTEAEARVQEHLSRIEQGKRSDTELGWSAFGPREVIQKDMFPDTETHGAIFDTPEAFTKFLASDALNESRKAVGLALQTSARAYKLVAPLQARAAQLRGDIVALQNKLDTTKRTSGERIEAAQAAHAAAVERLRAQERELDLQLQPLQTAYIAAQLELSKAADTLANVLDSIAKNTAKFSSDSDLQQLAAAAAQAQEAHAALLRRASTGGKVTSEDTARVYADVVAAINAHRAGLEQYLKTDNQIQERSILAFLNRDLELMLRLRDAEQSVERANEGLNNARDQLNAANTALRSSEAYLTEQRENKRGEAHARGVVTKARNTAARNTERIATELQTKADEQAALDAEIREMLDAVERASASRVEAKPQEAQSQREARDAQTRIEEQARLERLQAIPGTTVRFEQARDTMAHIEKLQERAQELEERAKDATASTAMRNKDKYEAAGLRKEIDIATAALANEPELATAAKEALATLIAEVDVKIDEKKVAILEPGKQKKTIDQRRKDLTALQTKRRSLVRLQNITQQRAKKAEILTPKQRAEEAQDAANRLTLERGINAATGNSQGSLPLRKAGPLIKPVLGGKVTQSGRAPKMRANEQAMAELSKIETLLEKAQVRLEEAQENNDAEAIEKYTGFVARLEKARDVSEAALEKTSRVARAVSGGEKVKAKEVDRLRGTLGPNDTALTIKTLSALNNGDARTAVAQVAAASTNPIARRVAAKIAPMMGDVKSQLVTDMPGDVPDAPGGVSKTGKTIFMNRRTGLSEETLMHESVHSVTVANLTKPENQLTPDQLAAKRELEDMHAALMQLPEFDNTVIRDGDLAEFVAEGHASRPVQALMAKTPWSGATGGKNMLQRFWQNILRLIGVNTPPKGPMLDKFLALSEKFMQAPAPTTASTAVKDATAPARLRATAEPGSARETIDLIVARDKSWWDKLRGAASGLYWETALVDRFAGLERVSKVMEALRGSQMMYYFRMYDQRNTLLSVAATVGVPQRVEKLRKDGRKQYLIEGVEGANLRDIGKTLSAAPIKDKKFVSQLFTGYLAAIRAKNKGIETLNFGVDKNGQPIITPAKLAAIMQEVENTPGLEDVFKDARKQYNEYNRNLIKLLEQSGVVTKEQAARLVAQDDYVPYYREDNGVVSLLIGSESPIRIGNMKEQPHLQELVGGDRPILDWTTSAIQNTSMILDTALNNMATRNAAYELQDMGMATIGDGHTVDGNTIIKFYVNGEKKFARVDTPEGIPADLLVKGMAGIPTQLSGVVRLLAMPAQLLRKAVTISPVYQARAVVRDSMGAALGSGANIIPIYSALKEINSKNKAILNNRGITGGQVFTGTSDDMAVVLREITAGKPGWLNVLAKMEAMGREADALTRRAQYNSYIEQGMDEMEATLQTLESMNFSKRGASPSMHIANALIPFLNAQVQSLNVLYKSFRGQMPNNERLNIRGKLLARGTLLAATSLVYAAAMEDDEAYKDALPEQKYGNWFVRVPGVDEPLRIPVPFELGYIFKSVPEALYNSMTDKHGGDEAVKAFKTILWNTVPGGSSYFLPQAVKPLIEVGTGTSMFTGRPILSRLEQSMEKPFQFREKTTELAKAAGQITGASPIMMEHILNGYTSSTGMFVLSAIDSLMPTGDGPEKATRRMSSMPMFGGVFQPNNAGAIINDTYDKMGEFVQFKKTVDGLLDKGEKAKAMQLLKEREKEYAGADVGEAFMQKMGSLAKAARAIRASDRTAAEKDALLAKVDAYRRELATSYREVYGQIKGE
jgi:hypothetical protein